MKTSKPWIMPCLYIFLIQVVFAFIYDDHHDQKPILPTTITTADSTATISPVPVEVKESLTAANTALGEALEILLSSIVTTTTTYYSETSHVVLATYGVYAANTTRTVPINNKTIDVTMPLRSLPLRTVWVSHLTFVVGPRVQYVPTVSDITTSVKGDVQGIGFKPPTAAPVSPSQVVRPFCHKDQIANLTIKMPQMVAAGHTWTEKVTFQESYSGFYCHQTYSKHRINGCMEQFTTPMPGVKTLVDLPALRQTILASPTVVAAPHWGVTRGDSKRAIKEKDCDNEESCLVHCEIASHWFKRPQFKLIIFGVPMIFMVVLAFAFAQRLGRRGKTEKTAATDKEATPSSTEGIFRGRRGVGQKVEPLTASIERGSARNNGRNPSSQRSATNEAVMDAKAVGAEPGPAASDHRPPQTELPATRSDNVAEVVVNNSNPNLSTHSDKKTRDRYTTGSETTGSGDSHAFQRKKSEH